MRLTINNVTKALRELYGPEVELVKGEGYFYFIDAREDRYDTESEHIFQLGQISFDEWINRGRAYFDREIIENEPSNIVDGVIVLRAWDHQDDKDEFCKVSDCMCSKRHYKGWS